MLMVHQNGQGGDSKRAAGGSPLCQSSNLRVKRTMLSGRRAGAPCTPIPRWKLYENPFYDGIAAAAAAAARRNATAGGRHVAVSARKLAATLWELQELSPALASSKGSPCPCEHSRPTPVKKPRNHLLALTNLTTRSPPRSSPQPSPSPNSTLGFLQDSSSLSLQPTKGWDLQQSSQTSRQVAAMRSHVHRLLERRIDRSVSQIASASNNDATCMIETQKHLNFPSHLPLDGRSRRGDSECITTSNELLKVLDRIRSLEDQHTCSTSMVTTLRVELEHARLRVHDLELALKSSRREIDTLLKKFQEERSIWRTKEHEKIRVAIQSVKLEVEDERKLRRRMEAINRKLSRELVEANTEATKAMQELERERKARVLMEDVCDELAREIGEDKAEVEELKRESARVREEVEEERKMLQMAEVWREERVQMKLGEARLELEEKNNALDNLRCDLECFLRTKKALSYNNADEDDENSKADLKEAEDLRIAMDSMQLQAKANDSCGSPDTDGAPSDLYSVELNNEVVGDRGPWSYVSGPPLEERNAIPWETDREAENEWMLDSRTLGLDRLRKKWEDTALLPKEELRAENADLQKYGSGSLEIEKEEGSEWNCDSEELQDDDAKDEDGSQWESASEQDAEVTTCPSPQFLSGGGIEDLNLSPSDDVYFAGFGSTPSLKPKSKLLPGDDVWKVSPSVIMDRLPFKLSHEENMSGAASRNGSSRGMGDSARMLGGQASHIRLAAEQGTGNSPSRDWRSPDRGNPHIAQGIKGFVEWPRMSKDNGPKGKFVEGKLEQGDRRFRRQST